MHNCDLFATKRASFATAVVAQNGCRKALHAPLHLPQFMHLTISIAMVLIHIPPDRFAFLALELMGFRLQNEAAAQTKNNVDRFLSCFGTTPEAASAIFDDLQTTTIQQARIESKDIKFKYFI